MIKLRELTLLAIDQGSKVTGLALFNPNQYHEPLPYERIVHKGNQDLEISEIKNVIENESVDAIVIGLPLYLDGNESEQTKSVKIFKKRLESQLKNIKIYFQDEGLTTKEAKSRMKNSARYDFKVNLEKIDSLAASIILEEFLSCHACKFV